MTHAPAATRQRQAPLYERDPYAWSLEQARLLREGRLNEIDAENIAEEILDVGKTEYRVLESALRVLLTHMLKWDYQPERRSGSWEAIIAVQRNHAVRQLRDNPSLQSRRDEAVSNAYEDARRLAAGETELGLSEFPLECPYDWDTIVERPFQR
jgi:hypothetical protein